MPFLKKRPFLIPSILLAATISGALVSAQAPDAAATRPFTLVENAGQWNAAAHYRAERPNATAWFVRNGWVLDLAGRTTAPTEDDPTPQDFGLGAVQTENRSGLVVSMRFQNASPTARPLADRKLDGYYNFLRGRDESRWQTRVPSYQRLRYEALYPGIDVVVRPGRGIFAYDLHVAAGARVADIVVQCNGTDSLSIDGEGRLVLQTPVGTLRQSAPVSWQTHKDGTRHPVAARFVSLGKNRFGFAVQQHDPELPLVIDPDMDWATFFGGSDNDWLVGVDRASGTGSSAKILIAGGTWSSDYPTKNGPYTTAPGSLDAVISHLDTTQSSANQIIWSTYLGTDRVDWCYHARAQANGTVTAVGFTASSQFPTTANALRRTLNSADRIDGFLTTLNAAGTAISYSTLFGADFDDWINDFDVNGPIITIAGYSNSVDAAPYKGLPVTTNCFQPTRKGSYDAFVARILVTNTATTVTYCTYLGGLGMEGHGYDPQAIFAFDMRTMGMKVDGQGRILISGKTQSTDFPTSANAFQPNRAGGASLNYDAFVALLDPSQAVPQDQLVYSTYLGGDMNEGAMSCDLAPNGQICAAGFTYTHGATDPFPTTAGAYNRNGTTPGKNDWFITFLDATKSGAAQLAYSTRFGTDDRNDACSSVFVDDQGAANAAGYARNGFPTTPDAFQSTPQGNVDAIFLRLIPAGQGAQDLHYSTRFGSPAATRPVTFGFDCAPDGAGGVFLAGWSEVSSLPVTNGSTHVAARDGFAAHLWGRNVGVDLVGASTPAGCAGDLLFGAQGAPTRGNGSFRLAAWNVEPSATGFLGLGTLPAGAIPLCGAQLEINPLLILGIAADAAGEWSAPTPIPSATTLGTKVAAQTLWASTSCCLVTSNALLITVK